MDKTITFTMEDALLSPISMAILTKANFKTMSTDDPIHGTAKINAKGTGTYGWEYSEGAFIVTAEEGTELAKTIGRMIDYDNTAGSEKPSDMFSFIGFLTTEQQDDVYNMKKVKTQTISNNQVVLTLENAFSETPSNDAVLFLDFYYKLATVSSENMIMTIEPESFEGNFYLEASTLFRDKNGVDLPAEFIIPNCKPQSAMTFAMSGTGDPSTFTFTMDAFPGYTKYDGAKKVLAAIQVMQGTADADTNDRTGLTQF